MLLSSINVMHDAVINQFDFLWNPCIQSRLETVRITNDQLHRQKVLSEEQEHNLQRQLQETNLKLDEVCFCENVSEDCCLTLHEQVPVLQKRRQLRNYETQVQYLQRSLQHFTQAAVSIGTKLRSVALNVEAPASIPSHIRRLSQPAVTPTKSPRGFSSSLRINANAEPSFDEVKRLMSPTARAVPATEPVVPAVVVLPMLKLAPSANTPSPQKHGNQIKV